MSITQTGHSAAIETERHVIDVELAAALHAVGNSALGFPGSVDTFRTWLAGHGLSVCLMLKSGEC